jgi:hypothetical protein
LGDFSEPGITTNFFFPLGIYLSQGGEKGKNIYDAACHGQQSPQPRRALQESSPLSALLLMAPYSGQPHGLKL